MGPTAIGQPPGRRLRRDSHHESVLDPHRDRTREHLGSSDAMLIRGRRRQLAAAKELAEQEVMPYSADHPEVYRQRSGGVILPEGVDWIAATDELRKAYVEHPELDPALAGR